MIKSITINNYKCLDSEVLELAPLTLITGLNSTGKSSLMQAILLVLRRTPAGYTHLRGVISNNFDVIRNKYLAQNSLSVRVELEDGTEYTTEIKTGDDSDYLDFERYPQIAYEEVLFYLSANRIGAEGNAKIPDGNVKIGYLGDYVFGTFDKEKSQPVIPELIKYEESYTLQGQVNYWLSYILNLKVEISSEKMNNEQVEVRYKSEGLVNVSPFQLGAGVSYLAKILIMCLRTKKGGILMIENPEIHLYPDAQTRLGEFFAFMIKGGIQLILETHCDHLINRIRYAVYKGDLLANKVQVLYKGGIREPFQVMKLNNAGSWVTNFPQGFFDATLDCLLEME